MQSPCWGRKPPSAYLRPLQHQSLCALFASSLNDQEALQWIQEPRLGHLIYEKQSQCNYAITIVKQEKYSFLLTFPAWCSKKECWGLVTKITQLRVWFALLCLRYGPISGVFWGFLFNNWTAEGAKPPEGAHPGPGALTHPLNSPLEALLQRQRCGWNLDSRRFPLAGSCAGQFGCVSTSSPVYNLFLCGSIQALTSQVIFSLMCNWHSVSSQESEATFCYQDVAGTTH